MSIRKPTSLRLLRFRPRTQQVTEVRAMCCLARCTYRKPTADCMKGSRAKVHVPRPFRICSHQYKWRREQRREGSTRKLIKKPVLPLQTPQISIAATYGTAPLVFRPSRRRCGPCLCVVALRKMLCGLQSAALSNVYLCLSLSFSLSISCSTPLPTCSWSTYAMQVGCF